MEGKAAQVEKNYPFELKLEFVSKVLIEVINIQ